MEGKIKGYSLVVFSAFLWATTGIFGGLLLDGGLSSGQVAFLRMFGSSSILFLIFVFFNPSNFKIDGKGILLTMLFGLLGQATLNWFYFETLRLTSVSTITVFLYTSPAFIAVLAYFIFGEIFDSGKAIALILSFGGCLLVSTGGDLGNLVLNLPGIFNGLGAGATFAIFTIMCKYLSDDYNEFTIIFYAMVFGWIFFLPFSQIGGILDMEWSAGMVGTALMHWLIPTVIGYSIYIKAYTYGIESSAAGILASMEVVFAAVLSFAVFGEEMGIVKIVGILLVMCGASVFAVKLKTVNTVRIEDAPDVNEAQNLRREK